MTYRQTFLAEALGEGLLGFALIGLVCVPEHVRQVPQLLLVLVLLLPAAAQPEVLHRGSILHRHDLETAR